MTNIVRFPGGRPMPAAVIPRAEFERLACLALDVADRIVALLDETDGASRLDDAGSIARRHAVPADHEQG